MSGSSARGLDRTRLANVGPYMTKEKDQPPCIEQIGFDNVRESVALKVPTGPLPLPFLPRDPSKTSTPVQVVLKDFKAGNTAKVDWLVNGNYVSERGGQVVYSVPVFQAGESLTPDLIAAPNPGMYSSAADRMRFGESSRFTVVMQSPFVAVPIDQEALDRLGVTEEKPLVCRLLVVNTGPEDLVVGIDEPYPVGGGSLTVEEIGCLPAGTPVELAFSPTVDGALGALGARVARASIHAVADPDDES